MEKFYNVSKFPITSYKGVDIFRRIYYSDFYQSYLTQYYAYLNGKKRVYCTLKNAKLGIERSIQYAERSR